MTLIGPLSAPRWRGNARAVTTLAEALDDPKADAVDVCTPHHLHAAAADTDVTLFYGETNHTRPAAGEAARVIAEGRIGRMVGLQATCVFWQGGSTFRRPGVMAPTWRAAGSCLTVVSIPSR